MGDDPAIAELLARTVPGALAREPWFYVSQNNAVAAGHLVRSRLHEGSSYIISFQEREKAEQVAEFMNQNSHDYRPDERPLTLAQKFFRALREGSFSWS